MSDLAKYSDDDIIAIISSDAEKELRNRGYDYGWYKKEPFVGAIYILVNPAFPKLVKIGYADDVAKRVKTLNSSSGLPDPFHCYAVYKVKKRLEDLKLHSLIDSLDPALRHSKNREFYEMDCQKAYDILSAIAQINGNEEQLTKNPFADNYFHTPAKAALPAAEAGSTPPGKKPKMSFAMLGIPKGSKLFFTKDPSIFCTTLNDERRVEYNGASYALSTLAAKLLNISSAQGASYFTYNGEKLTDIRERLGV